MKSKPLTLACCAMLLIAATAHGAETSRVSASAANTRYTFSWPLDADAVKPRGGSTQGAPLTLDHTTSPAWASLQETGLSAFERDRRAILAMAGDYRVTFDFLEVVAYLPLDKPNPPYQSWGTERIYIDSDEGEFISLVHILEMRIVQKDGAISEPMVTKHWRQDWRYEPDSIVAYQGRDQWRERKLDAAQTKGAWAQSVYQVDESPRYASVGRWEHTASFSTWSSGETWRPLPRREWSVRDDYQLLIGTNRHTIGRSGWIQEENNLKAVITDARALDASRPYLGREYGVARYERLKGANFAAANQYYARTRPFWRNVRDAWTNAFAQQGTITLRGPVDKLGLFVPLFERADQIATESVQQAKASEDAELIRAALKDMGAIR
jgi:hypothetical protein